MPLRCRGFPGVLGVAPGPENPLQTRLVSIHKWSADFWVPIGGALLGGMFAPHRRSLGRETVPRRIVWSRPRLHADCGAAHASPNDLSTLSRLSPCPPLPFIIRAKEDTASRASARTPSLQDSFHNRDCWKASTATCPWPPPPFELCTASPRPVLFPLLSWSRRALPFPRAGSQLEC